MLVVSQTVYRSRSQTPRGKLSLFYDETEHFGKTDKIYIVLFNFDAKNILTLMNKFHDIANIVEIYIAIHKYLN